MRLVIDLQGAQSGSRFRGIGRYCVSIAKAMARVGAEHEIFCTLSSLLPDANDFIVKELNPYLPKENIRVWRGVGPTRELDSGNDWRRSVSERIRETYLASLQPDLVFIPSLFEGLSDDAVCTIDQLRHGIPTATVVHDLIPLFNPDEHFRANARHRRWYRRKIQSLKRSSLLLAVSDASRQEALSTGFFDEDSVITISGACSEDFRVVDVTPGERESLWKRMGISRRFVMYAGAADGRKNLDRLIEAYAALPPELRRVHQLVFVGMMPEGNIDEYRRCARKSGLADDELVFTGYVEDPDLVKLYNTCKLFVFPSTQEGFGLPPLEAMGCGAPVIAANRTSVPEVVGLPEALFDPFSVSDIRIKLERALIDRTFLALLRDHGSRQFRRFSWERSAEAALHAFQRFIPPRAARVPRRLTVESTAHFEERRLRILVIKLDHLGDFLLAIPALSKLRARYPYASIELVIGSWNASVARELKLFDEIHAFDFFKRRSSEPPSAIEESVNSLVNRLGRFDIAIDLRRQSDTRFLLGRVDADLRVGYSALDGNLDSDVDVVIPSYPDVAFRATPMNRTSISIQMLRIIDAIPSNPNDYIVLPKLIQCGGATGGRIGIFPKAGSPAREWARPNFERLVELLVGDPLVEAIDVYFVDECDREEFSIAADDKIAVHTGLEFRELTQALGRDSVCVANNSGGAHLASYLGVTVVGIYSGHELPLEWGPQFANGLVVHRAAQCAPCHGGRADDCPNGLFCLTDITVDAVYRKAIEGLLSRAEPAKSGAVSNSRLATFQYSTDSLVRRLVSSIGEIEGAEERDAQDVAVAIAANHPDYSLPDMASLQLNVPVDHKSIRVEWQGFSGIEPGFRWTEESKVAMVFECPEGTPRVGNLIMKIDTLGEQRIVGFLNRKKVAESVQTGTQVPLRIAVDNLESGINVLELELPDARLPGNGDTRKLAIAVREFTVEVCNVGNGALP